MSGKRLLSKSDYYFPVGLFLQATLFGFYTALFGAAIWIWTKRRARATTAGLLYLILNILMWCVACAYLVISFQRVLRVFILELEVDSLPPLVRLRDSSRWDTVTAMSLEPSMIWLGDILVVYRTYIVWNRSLWVLAFPLAIDSVNLVLNILCMYWATHPEVIALRNALPWFLALYPLVLAQNILTTGLLSYKVWSQHRESVAHGVVISGGGHTLGYVARIMIETALLYTLQLFVICILAVLDHPATYLVIQCMVSGQQL